MLYNGDIYQGYAIAKDNSKKVFILISGFYPRSQLQLLDSFIKNDLHFNKVTPSIDYNFNQECLIELHQSQSPRDLFLILVLTKPFKNKTEAELFLLDKINNSKQISKKDFSDIFYLDGDVFQDDLKSRNYDLISRTNAEKMVKEKLAQACLELINQYPENTFLVKEAQEKLNSLIMKQ